MNHERLHRTSCRCTADPRLNSVWDDAAYRLNFIDDFCNFIR